MWISEETTLQTLNRHHTKKEVQRKYKMTKASSRAYAYMS
jgi:hypothetical protein